MSINILKPSFVAAVMLSLFAMPACVGDESSPEDADIVGGDEAAAEGSGWREYTDGAYVHFEEGHDHYTREPWKGRASVSHGDGEYRYDRDSNTETFILRGSRTNRIEFHGASYNSGQQQLEGEIRVNDGATDGVWVAQAWHTALVKYERENGGQLVYHSASEFNGDPRVEATKTLVTGIRGKWTKVNLIHDASRNKIKIYINGEPVFEHATGHTRKDYFLKYGTYDASGSDDETVQWRNTKVYRK